MIEWVQAEPAPHSVVQEFASYAPQLGYLPDARGAILVAVEGRDVRLYSTENDKGELLPRPQGAWPPFRGGRDMHPARVGGGAADRRDARRRGRRRAVVDALHRGRSDRPDARAVRFTDLAGRPLTRPIGFDGFFVASVDVPRSACGAGDWRPTFAVLDADMGEIVRAAITLLFDYPSPGVCGSIPPHPPSVR